MDEMEHQWVAQFLGEQWANFVAFMDERGEDEAACEALLEKIEQQAGMR